MGVLMILILWNVILRQQISQVLLGKSLKLILHDGQNRSLGMTIQDKFMEKYLM